MAHNVLNAKQTEQTNNTSWVNGGIQAKKANRANKAKLQNG